MKEKQYQRNDVYIPQLQTEIEAESKITIALDFIDISQNILTVAFKDNLNQDQETLLDGIVSSHIPSDNSKPSVVPISISSPSTTEDDIPYVYNTSKPQNHYVCFQGAGDDLTSENTINGIGKGERVAFNVKASDSKLSKIFQFNDTVYVKDGYMIVQNAPFGATVDIDVHHPLVGLLFPFARSIPILGSGWFPLDTEDRAILPKGLFIKITVYNASGENDQDDPADFKIFGRFELFRRSPPGT